MIYEPYVHMLNLFVMSIKYDRIPSHIMGIVLVHLLY
jgi:hypothetical protein